jgi:hypothetical protein
MPQRLKKLIGSIVLVVFVGFYALTVMTVAAAKLPGTSHLTQLIFYVVGGLAWVIPAGALILWMQRPSRKKDLARSPNSVL